MATQSIAEQLEQLQQARQVALGNPAHYPKIVEAITKVIGPDQPVEVRRWGADFFAETFASPKFALQEKSLSALSILEKLKIMLDNPKEDSRVTKSLVQTAASIYPMVFKWIINNGYDTTSWGSMTSIKSRILRIWETSVPGIRICCIKFAQRVILAQTSGAGGELREGDLSGISLAMVPQTHPLIPPRNLEAEASGLLDRMLGVFQENDSDAVLVDATLNSLSLLIRARPLITNKILNAILNFNPLKLANSPMTPKSRVMIKSMEKTTRMLLMHFAKRDPQNPLTPKIHQYIDRQLRSKAEILDEATKKREFGDILEGPESVKRQRVEGANVFSAAPSTQQISTAPAPVPRTLADLFTLSGEESVKSFDVGVLKQDIIIDLVVNLLTRTDSKKLQLAINGVRERYLAVEKSLPSQETINPYTAPLGVDDDDDDYEPDFEPMEDAEQIQNKLDNAPVEEIMIKPPELPLATFKMPSPQPLSSDETAEIGQNTVSRVFGVMRTLDDTSVKKSKAGLNRLAASSYDREAWITVISRIATRGRGGLEDTTVAIKDESPRHASLSDEIRESLYLYIIEDFRRRIDIAVSWLCEEWYSDRMLATTGMDCPLYYEKWVLRVLDGMKPYLDARDKVFTRFLSEIPALSKTVLDRVVSLCRDPLMVNLALTSLLYLVMMRPPAREIALDAVEEIWRTYDDARPMASKYLTKWRPGFVERNSDTKDSSDFKAELKPAQNGVSVST